MKMANYYWPIVAATLAVIIISIALPLLLAEVFPWRNLYKQRNAKLTVTAKSYKGKGHYLVVVSSIAHLSVKTIKKLYDYCVRTTVYKFINY